MLRGSAAGSGAAFGTGCAFSSTGLAVVFAAGLGVVCAFSATPDTTKANSSSISFFSMISSIPPLGRKQRRNLDCRNGRKRRNRNLWWGDIGRPNRGNRDRRYRSERLDVRRGSIGRRERNGHCPGADRRRRLVAS